MMKGISAKYSQQDKRQSIVNKENIRGNLLVKISKKLTFKYTFYRKQYIKMLT